MSEFGDKYYFQRELIIESVWWLLHRLSAFDRCIKVPAVVSLVVDSLEYFKLDKKVGYPSRSSLLEDHQDSSEPVPLALAPALSMALVHAARMDTIGASDAEPRAIYYAMKRCVKSIIECRILPAAMNWIPLVFKNIIRQPCDLNAGSDAAHIYVFVVRAIGCFAAGTISLLSEMPVDIAGDPSSDPNYNIVITETITGLQNVLSLPLFILQYDIQLMDIFWDVEQFLTSGVPEDNLSNEILLDNSLKFWTTLFEVLVDVLDLQMLYNYLKLFVSTGACDSYTPKSQSGSGFLTAYRLIKSIIETIQKKINKLKKQKHFQDSFENQCGDICSKLFLLVQNVWSETIVNLCSELNPSSKTLHSILSADIAFYTCNIISLSQHYLDCMDISVHNDLLSLEYEQPIGLNRAINIPYNTMILIEKYLISKGSEHIGLYQKFVNAFLSKMVMAWSRCVSAFVSVTETNQFLNILHESTERFVQKICLSTFFSSSLKALLASLVQEMSSIREIDYKPSPIKSNPFIGTSKYALTGNKRTFLDIKSHGLEAPYETSHSHSKQQKHSETLIKYGTQRIKISAVGSDLESSLDCKGVSTARQWSGVPHLYSSLDRDDFNSQSQIEDSKNKFDSEEQLKKLEMEKPVVIKGEKTCAGDQCYISHIKKLLDKITLISDCGRDNVPCNCGDLEIDPSTLTSSSVADIVKSIDMLWKTFMQKQSEL